MYPLWKNMLASHSLVYDQQNWAVQYNHYIFLTQTIEIVYLIVLKSYANDNSS